MIELRQTVLQEQENLFRILITNKYYVWIQTMNTDSSIDTNQA